MKIQFAESAPASDDTVTKLTDALTEVAVPFLAFGTQSVTRQQLIRSLNAVYQRINAFALADRNNTGE